MSLATTATTRALIGAIALTLCAAAAADDAPPNMKRIVQLNLQTPNDVETSLRRERGPPPPEVSIFTASKLVSHVEILDSQMKVQHSLYGWTWQTCIRASVGITNTKVTLAVFVLDHRVVDARTALDVDRCGEGVYVALPVKRPAKPAPAKSGSLTATSST
jgi:hypothetical protein